MRTLRWRRSDAQTDEAPRSDLPTKRPSEPSFQWDYIPSEAGADGPYTLVESSATDATTVNTALIQEISPGAEVSGDGDQTRSPLPGEAEGAVSLMDGSAAVEEQASADTVLDLVVTDAATRYLRHNLDVAADRWRADGVAPAPALTERGLEALAAGTALTQEQTSLLLRSALYHRKSAATALRFQKDPERTALIMTEAMTVWQRPLAPELVLGLRGIDPQGREWFELLLQELQAASGNSDVRTRRKAVAALEQLYQVPVQPNDGRASLGRFGPFQVLAAFGALMVVLVVVAFVLWAHNRPETDFVQLPAGAYTIAMSDGQDLAIVAPDAFALQTHEVTNEDYAVCVASGECEPPTATEAAGIPDYFSNQAYALYPVVNVTYEQAEQYCRHLGLRLPTAQEWMLGAAAAPATNMALVYPWGNEFDLQRANTVESGFGAPTTVGSHSPAGDSPIGAADMAGNAAEWTATTPDDGTSRVAKGGSYKDTSAEATAMAEQVYASGASTDWLGFRCIQAHNAD